jgi:predicted ATPase
MHSLGLRDRQQEAIDMGIKVLQSVGETFPRRVCMGRLLKKMKKVEYMLRGKEDEQLLRLPMMTDTNKVMAMHILSMISLDALMMRPKFSPFIAMKMVTLTMKYGLSEHASSAFAT